MKFQGRPLAVSTRTEAVFRAVSAMLRTAASPRSPEINTACPSSGVYVEVRSA
jgi:hypothetical protein